jgi:hypothetical protein
MRFVSRLVLFYHSYIASKHHTAKPQFLKEYLFVSPLKLCTRVRLKLSVVSIKLFSVSSFQTSPAKFNSN